jgi:predicted esterase
MPGSWRHAVWHSRAWRRPIALGVILAGLLGAAWLVFRPRVAIDPAPPLTAAAAQAPAIDPPADWCAPEFEPIAGGGCFAGNPSTHAQGLVVYLHGRYPGDAAAEEVDRQSRLARRAKSTGFAVVALRSPPAICTAPELADWFCWPTSERYADAGAEIVQTWSKALAAARDRAGSRERFLLGFSSGGYFAGLIASRALLDVDGVVVAHGGPVEPVHALGPKPPLLLLSADDDVAQDDMIRLDTDLTREGWPHDSYARSGGHALTGEDIDAALTFFSRAHEPLPLAPPLTLHRPVAHVRDAENTAAQDGSKSDADDAGPLSDLADEGGP